MPKELIIILIVVLVIFGPSQIPKLAKTFGKSAKQLQDGLEGKLDDEDEKPVPTVEATSAAPSVEEPALKSQ